MKNLSELVRPNILGLAPYSCARDEFKGRDRSFEIEAYTRFGVAILTNHNWCVYENTTLANTENYPTKYPVE